MPRGTSHALGVHALGGPRPTPDPIPPRRGFEADGQWRFTPPTHAVLALVHPYSYSYPYPYP